MIIRTRHVQWGAVLLLAVLCSAAAAQITGSTNSSDRTSTKATEEPPPGGCTPIGVTASGEIVFPFLCKDFLEQFKTSDSKPAGGAGEAQRGADLEKDIPASVGVVVKEFDTDMKSETTGSVEGRRTDESNKKVSRVKAARSPEGRGSNSCMHYRSYNPGSRTYRDPRGRVRNCQS